MSEYQLSWFVDQESVASLCCTWCKNVVDHPVNMSCGHINCLKCVRKNNSTCGSCITSISYPSDHINFFIKGKVESQQVICQNPDCNKAVELGASGSGLSEHHAVCGFIPKPCTYCKIVMTESALPQHETQCKRRPTKCGICQEDVPFEDMENHTNIIEHPLGCAWMMHCVHGCTTKIEVSSEPPQKKQKKHRKTKDSDSVSSVGSSLALVLASQPAIELSTKEVHTYFPRNQRITHEEICPIKNISCGVCSIQYLRRDEVKHYTDNIVLHTNMIRCTTNAGVSQSLGTPTTSLQLQNFSTLWIQTPNTQASHALKINYKTMTVTLHRIPDNKNIHVKLACSPGHNFPLKLTFRVMLSKANPDGFDSYKGGYLLTSKQLEFKNVTDTITIPDFALDPVHIMGTEFYNVTLDSVRVNMYATLLAS